MEKNLKAKMKLNLSRAGSKWEISSDENYPEYQGIEIRIENSTIYSLTLDANFISYSEEVIKIAFNILPQTEITIPFDFELLNSQTLFPKRTLGRLRMMVTGKPIALVELEKIELSSRESHLERQIELVSAKLVKELSFGEIHCPKVLIDDFGQWNLSDWPGKISNIEDLKGRLNSDLVKISQQSEEKNDRIEEKKWFRVKKIDESWYFVDPNDDLFLSIGMDSIVPTIECATTPIEPFLPPSAMLKGPLINYCKQNLVDGFGENWYQKWQKLIAGNLKKWGINTIGNWSDFDFIKHTQMPYVLPLDRYSSVGFPSTEITIFRDFPDVFSPEYEKASKIYGESLNPFKEDPFLIGYFMRNEPEWAFENDVNLAEELIKMHMTTYSKKTLITYLIEKYHVIEKLSSAWSFHFESFDSLFDNKNLPSIFSEEAYVDLIFFSKKMIKAYIELPAKACKKVDPHHLNLGMRYAYIGNNIILECCEYFDVFSINCYQEDPTKKIVQVADYTDLPVLIGEFHFGALDRGMTATGIKGTTTQKDRGLAYNNYFEQAAKHPNFVGAHYFSLYDQPCLGRFDGENYQLGFLNVCSLPYEEFISEIEINNQVLLDIHTGIVTPKKRATNFIPPIYC